LMKSTIKAEIFINSPDRFFYYETLSTSSFSKNLITPEAEMFKKLNGYLFSMMSKKAHPFLKTYYFFGAIPLEGVQDIFH